MKASYAWIREYLPALDARAETVADWLTFTGTEIESVDPHGDDFIFDAGVTSNRADCLCHVGLAREIAAARGLELAPPAHAAEAGGAETSSLVSVEVADPELCGRYTARVIEGVRVGPSPEWLRRRLEALGLRPVNNVVDVTNFVLLELGQPLHAFDLDRLAGPRIVVRRAQEGETLRTLDGSDLELADGEDLVIADAERPVALAGVMGGEESEVGEGTTRILLESAWFLPRTVRRAARRHGLATDSSHRFERGVDRSAALRASERAARLILEVAGGELRAEPLDIGGAGAPRAPVALRPEFVGRVAGIAVETSRVRARLEALGCTIAGEGPFEVTPPSFRHDLDREIDLVEEVVRLEGFDAIPEEGGMGVRVVRPHPARALRERLSDRLAGFGVFETITADFVAEDRRGDGAFLVSGRPLVAETPVRKGEGRLRQSLLPSLLGVRKHNQDQGNKEVRIFETGRVTGLGADGRALASRPVLGLLLDGDGRDARGLVDALLAPEGIAASVAASEDAGLDPAARARLEIDGDLLGVFGRPERSLLKAYGLKNRPFYVELDLEVVRAHAVDERRYRPLPRFPVVERDLAVIVAEDVPFARLEAVLREVAPEHLESFELFDLYRGKKLGSGRKSLGLRFVFRSAERTLTSEEVESKMARLEKAFVATLEAEIRRA